MKTLLAEAAHPGLNIQDWLTLEPRERRETADSFPQDPFAPYCSRGWLKGEPAGRSLRFDEVDLLNRSVCFCFKTNVTSCFFFGHSFLSYLEVVGRSRIGGGRKWLGVFGSDHLQHYYRSVQGVNYDGQSLWKFRNRCMTSLLFQILILN